jgi:hypothetical protein
VARWPELDAYLRARGIRVGTATLGQTTGGKHAAGSYHYQGLARDHGLYNCDCQAIADALLPLAKGPNHIIVELIWTPSDRAGTYYKNGYSYTPSATLARGHRDHVHDAIRPGAPHYTQWPGYQAPKPPGGFLMALSDKEQSDLKNQITNIHEWLRDDRGEPVIVQRIRKAVQEELAKKP